MDATAIAPEDQEAASYMDVTYTSFTTLAEAVDQFRAELADLRWAHGLVRSNGADIAVLWVWDQQERAWQGYYNSRGGVFIPLARFTLAGELKGAAYWWDYARTDPDISIIAARFPAP